MSLSWEFDTAAGRCDKVEVVVARPERTMRRSHLRQLIGARLGVAPAAVELASNGYGKPVLGGRLAEAPLHFNVAYAGDMAVYAFAFGREVGIDVEAVRTFDAAAAVVGGFFSPHEQASYRALAEHERLSGFFNGWTRKEAFVKALGTGLHQALDSFDVSLAPHEAARILRVGNMAGERCGWTLQSFTPAPGLVAALVVRRFPGEDCAQSRPLEQRP